jgi:hypothetical protein
MSVEKRNVYKKEFLPLYDSKKFGKAEEIARKKDLGMLLDEEQMTIMALMVAHKNKDQLQNVLYYSGGEIDSDIIDFAINSYEDGVNRGDYWINIMEARKNI